MLVHVQAPPDPKGGFKLPAGAVSVTGTTSATFTALYAWLTAIHPFAEVWHVKSIKAVGVPGDYTSGDGLDKLAYINYWDDEGDLTTSTTTGKVLATNLWVDAFKDAGVTLSVKYTNGETKERTMEYARKNGMVWWNENPNLGGNNALIVPPAEEDNTFGIQNVRVSTTPENKLASTGGLGYAYNKLAGVQGPGYLLQEIEGPAVKVNYRGAETYIPVDIWINCDDFNATFVSDAANAAGYEVVQLKEEDNDIPANKFTAADFGAKIKAIATFSSVRGNTKTATIGFATGTTQANWNDGTAIGTAPGGYKMDFGVANKKGTAGWGQVANTANNNKVKAVTLYYKAPAYAATSGITKTPKNFKQTAGVEWHGILAP